MRASWCAPSKGCKRVACVKSPLIRRGTIRGASVTRLAVRLLGGLEVAAENGLPLTLATRKAALVFAMLARNPGIAVPRARLASLLWHNRGEDQARGSLRQALFAIRRAIEEAESASLVTTHETVMLKAQDMTVDAVMADGLAQSLDIEEIAELRSLYQGPLLDGWEIDEPEFLLWLRAERAKLEGAVLEALKKLLAWERDAGSLDAALATAEKICAIDPLSEETYRTAIRIHIERGERSAALKLFDRLETCLREELSAVPEPETMALVARLRRGISIEATPSARVAPQPKVTEPLTIAESEPEKPSFEQRHVAVLAIELAHDASESDPEQRHEILHRFEAQAQEAVRELGGLTERRGPSRIVAIFGATIAYGNDCERALRAADRMAKALLEADETNALKFALGLGPAFVELRSSLSAMPLVTGPVVEGTEDLLREARAGDWLLSASARDSLGARVEVDRANINASESQLVWRLVSFRSDSSASFVGRVAEIAQIDAILDNCLTQRRGRIIHIRGEPGIGKTKLAEEARRRAVARGFESHTALVLDFGGRSRRDPMRTIVRSLQQLDDVEAPDAETLRIAERLAAGESMNSEYDEAAFIYDLLDLPSPPKIHALLDAMDHQGRLQGIRRAARALVAQAASSHPLFVLVEDLQWVDSIALESLAELAVLVQEHPILIVLTSRIEGDPLTASWRAKTRGAALTTIDLGPMANDEALALAHTLGTDDQEFVQACMERAAGHPLFLEQLFRLRGLSDTRQVPPSVRSIVQVRLDHLDTAARSLIQAASTLGQRFDAEALGFLLGDSSVDIEPLIAGGLVRADGHAFIFAHALLRDAIYETLLPRRLRAFHARAAEWFENRDLTLRAEHLEKAKDDRAADAYRFAAVAQHRDYRYGRARNLVLRGLGLAKASNDKASLSLLLGDIDHDLGHMAQADEAFAQALLVADTEIDQCRALIGRASVKRVIEDLDGAFDDVEEALKISARLGDHGTVSVERSRAEFLRGNLLFHRGEPKRCLEAHETSLKLARRAKRPELEAAALGGIGDAQYLAGLFKSAYETLNACVEICRQHGYGRIEVANHSQLACAVQSFWPQRDALAVLEAAGDGAIRVGHKRAAINARAGRIWALRELGEFEKCVEVALEARARVRELGTKRYEQIALMGLGAGLVELGETKEGLTRLREGIDVAFKTGPGFHGAEVCALLALHSPQRDEALTALQRMEHILSGRFISHSPLHAYPIAARAALNLGEPDRARRYVATLEAYMRKEPLDVPKLYADVVRSEIEPHKVRKAGLKLRAEELHLFNLAERLD